MRCLPASYCNKSRVVAGAVDVHATARLYHQPHAICYLGEERKTGLCALWVAVEGRGRGKQNFPRVARAPRLLSDSANMSLCTRVCYSTCTYTVPHSTEPCLPSAYLALHYHTCVYAHISLRAWVGGWVGGWLAGCVGGRADRLVASWQGRVVGWLGGCIREHTYPSLRKQP